MATPVAVPLVRSSNLDCSQVLVPSAREEEIRAQRVSARKKDRRGFCNGQPRFRIGAARLRVARIQVNTRMEVPGWFDELSMRGAERKTHGVSQRDIVAFYAFRAAKTVERAGS